MLATLRAICGWEQEHSPRLEYILHNTLLALLDVPGNDPPGRQPDALRQKQYRDWVVRHVKDPSVRTFWQDEFESYTERYAAEAIPAIQNKVGKLLSNPTSKHRRPTQELL